MRGGHKAAPSSCPVNGLTGGRNAVQCVLILELGSQVSGIAGGGAVRVSMKADYALRAMLELASAQGRGPIQSSEVAARRGIPESYLEQLMTGLRRAGLVASARGPSGGHYLARHPSAITARDVVRAMEGPVVAIDSVDSKPAGEPESVVRELWLQVREAVEKVLGEATLEDLLARELVKSGWDTYHI